MTAPPDVAALRAWLSAIDHGDTWPAPAAEARLELVDAMPAVLDELVALREEVKWRRGVAALASLPEAPERAQAVLRDIVEAWEMRSSEGRDVDTTAVVRFREPHYERLRRALYTARALVGGGG